MNQEPSTPQSSPNPATPQQQPINPSPVAAALPLIPNEWPGAFGVFKYSKNAVMLNIGAYLILLVISMILSVIGNNLSEFVSFIFSIVSIFFSIALTFVLIAGAQGRKTEAIDALKMSVTYFLKYLGLSIIVGLSLVLAFFAFIIPFFIVLPRLILAFYYLLDQNMGIIDSYKASLAATKGHSLKIWGILLASFVMILPALTIIGIPVAIYLGIMYSAATVVLYEFIKKANKVQAPVSGTPNPQPTNPEPQATQPTQNTQTPLV